MNDIERTLQETLAEAADSAPKTRPMTEYTSDATNRSARRWRWPVAAALGTAAVITSFVLVGSMMTQPNPTDPANANQNPPLPSKGHLVPGDQLALPTNTWQPGDPAELALGGGELRVDGQGCLLAADRLLVWPAGYTAAIGDDGLVRVLDPQGSVVAVSGQTFRAGGGSGPTNGQANGWTDNNCFNRYAGAFSIQEEMSPLPTSDVAVQDSAAGCGGPEVITSSGASAPLGQLDLTRLHLQVGENISVTTDGYCASIWLEPRQRPEHPILKPSGDRGTLIATTPGTAKVEVKHAMCDGVDQPCYGGIAVDGAVLVRVGLD